MLLGSAFMQRCVYESSASVPRKHLKSSSNAVWLGVEWVMEDHSRDEIIALADELAEHQVRYVFVFVSYLRCDGKFNPTYAHAGQFISTLRASEPMLNVQAWIGLPLTQSGPFSMGCVNLQDPATRQKIALFSGYLVHQEGFDGIHLDPEPVRSGDINVLVLLDEVRSVLGRARDLSIASRRIQPFFSHISVPLLGNWAWRASYYREVAKRVDQVIVMTYDSSLPLPQLYRRWVHRQVLELTRVLQGLDVEVLIGVPTSEERTWTHWPSAENIVSGLQGVLDGLGDVEAYSDTVKGVAIYPYWETDRTEWATYRRLWLER